jgi:hypothetical protein
MAITRIQFLGYGRGQGVVAGSQEQPDGSWRAINASTDTLVGKTIRSASYQPELAWIGLEVQDGPVKKDKYLTLEIDTSEKKPPMANPKKLWMHGGRSKKGKKPGHDYPNGW